SRLKIFVWSLIGLSVIGIAVFYFTVIRNASSYEFIAVERRDVTQEVTVTGAIKSASAVDLEFLTSGRIVSIPVKVGDTVKAGQFLIALDGRDANLQVQKAEAALAGAEAKLRQLKAGATSETINELENNLKNTQASADASISKKYALALDYMDSAVTKADKIMTSMESDLFSNKNTVRTDFTLSSSQVINDVQTKKTFANDAVQQIRIFRDNAAISGVDQGVIDSSLAGIPTQLEKIRTLAVSATDLITSMTPNQSISQTTINTYFTNITANRSDFDSGIANLRQIAQDIANQKAANQKLVQDAIDALNVKKEPPRQVDIDVLEADVKAKQADLGSFMKQRSDTALVSPMDAIVTNIPFDIGEIARINSTAISLISPHALEIEANVPEIDISKLALGNVVQITIDAFQNENWTGKVTHIDPAQTIVDGVANYKIKVAFDKDDPRLKSGLTANLNIETLKKIGVIAIPQYGVSQRDNGAFVKIKENRQVVDRKVQLGISGFDGYIEIISGLEVGQNIVNQGLKQQ
ncbi:MAG: efflux RND transporter periplasmic adaptor subunit, partial [Patescibacteria group bacterium]